MKPGELLQHHPWLSRGVFLAGLLPMAGLGLLGIWSGVRARMIPSPIPQSLDLIHELAAEGELEKAMRGLRLAFEAESDPPKAEALLDLGKALKDLDAQLSAASFLAFYDPTPEHRMQLAEILAALGRYGESKTIYSALAAQSAGKDARPLLGMAAAHEAAGEFAEAMALYQRIVAGEPSNTDALFGYASTLGRLGNTEEAMRIFDRIIELDPSNVQSHNNRGILLAQAGRLDEAVASFQQALAVQPSNARTHANLAKAFRMMGKSAEAEYHETQAARLLSGDAPPPTPARNLSLEGPAAPAY